MQFDFQLGFGDPSTSGSSATSDSGGMQYTQTREHLHEHTSDSTYNHGQRTDYAYTDDTNQTIASFTSFGLSSASVVDPVSGQASESFDMDYFGTGVTFQQRHVEGDGTTETVSGHQGGSWSNALNFTVHIPTYGNLVFATTQSGFDDLEYSLSHQPGRDYLGNRVTSDQQYDLWHKTSGTDSATSLSFPGITPQTSESHTRTEETRLPDGSINSHDHSWGHNNGITYDSEWDSPRTLADQMPLWLADSFPIQSPGQGPSFAFTQLNNLYWQTGYNAGPVGQQWNTGTAPALTGQQLLAQVGNITPSWTGWINNQVINGTNYEKVWAEYRTLPSGRYVLTYYTAPPSENGQYLGYESDAPENQKLGRALAAMDKAYAPTKPAAPPNEQDEEAPVSALTVANEESTGEAGPPPNEDENPFKRKPQHQKDAEQARKRAGERLKPPAGANTAESFGELDPQTAIMVREHENGLKAVYDRDSNPSFLGVLITMGGQVMRNVSGVNYFVDYPRVVDEAERTNKTSDGWDFWFKQNGSTTSRVPVESELALQNLWKFQENTQKLSSEVMRLEKLLDNTSLSKGERRNLQKQVDQLRYQLKERLKFLGINPQGVAANGFDPVKRMELAEKFTKALQKAYDSGRLSEEVGKKIAALLDPVNIASMIGFFAIYAGIHASPLAPALLVADVGFMAAGGKEAALAIFDVYLALESATTPAELDEASNLLADKLAGPIADGVTSILMMGAAKAVNIAGKRFIPGLVEKIRFFKRMENLPNLELCFVAGTLVQTPAGLVPIETLRPGMLVLTRDESDPQAPVVTRPVEETFVTRPTELRHLTIQTENGATDTLVGTPNHPFYSVRHGGFVEAGELAVGDTLTLSDGQTATVTAIRDEAALPGKTFTTYNFAVADHHTYFVGQTGVWVHNTGAFCQRLKKEFFTLAGLPGNEKKTPEEIFATLKRLAPKLTDKDMNAAEVNKHLDDALKLLKKEGVEINAPKSSSPYALFNKTHAGSLPVPKGVGPNGGRLQSHHGLQQEWAANNIPGYDPKMAPTVTIETGKGFPHTILSNLQNARRDARVAAGLGKWSSSIDDELGFIVSDFRRAGFGDDVIRQVLEQNYRMLDKLGIRYTKPAGF